MTTTATIETIDDTPKQALGALPVSYKGLLRMVKKGESFSAYFPSRKSSWENNAWQLVISYEIPLRAKGEVVGRRNERHVIHFLNAGGAYEEEGPSLFLHASYGEADALRVLLEAEIKAAKKFNGDPRVRARASSYCGADEPAMGHYPSGQVVPIYTLNFSGFCGYLQTFGMIEPADKYGHRCWLDIAYAEGDTVHEITRHHRFSTTEAQ